MTRDIEAEVGAERLRILRKIEAAAVANAKSRKLEQTSARIRAAYGFTQAWQAAKERGMAKARFEEEVLQGLSTRHGGRTEFRLSRYMLKRSEMERLSREGINPLSVANYKSQSEPQKSLDAYLTGLRVAATFCGTDYEKWAIDMLSPTDLWKTFSNQQPVPGVDEADNDDAAPADIPAETLSILLSRMSRYVADKTKLPEIMSGILEMPCRWDMFEERLVSSSTNAMDRHFARIFPVGGAVYFEEMVPFPSIPLARQFVTTRKALLGLMPAVSISTDDLGEDDRVRTRNASFFKNPDEQSHIPGLPDDGDIEQVEGRVSLYNEVRLALAPNSWQRWDVVLECRPYVCVDLPDANGDLIRHHVDYAVDPYLVHQHFYPMHEENRLVLPLVKRDGETLRVACFAADMSEHEMSIDHSDAAIEPDTSSEHEELELEDPWQLTYAAASAAELRRLLSDIGDADGHNRPWNRDNFAAEVYEKDLPSSREFYFPMGNAFTDIEACLHNGLIEQALKEAILRLRDSANDLRSELTEAREAGAQRLLNRWHGKTSSGAI